MDARQFSAHDSAPWAHFVVTQGSQEKGIPAIFGSKDAFLYLILQTIEAWLSKGVKHIWEQLGAWLIPSCLYSKENRPDKDAVWGSSLITLEPPSQIFHYNLRAAKINLSLSAFCAVTFTGNWYLSSLWIDINFLPLVQSVNKSLGEIMWSANFHQIPAFLEKQELLIER